MSGRERQQQPVVKPEAPSAGQPEAVAPEKASAPEAKKCADCGSAQVVVITSDPAAEPTPYCAVHRPSNVELPAPDAPGEQPTPDR